MELAEEYLTKFQKIGGIYVLQVNDDVTLQQRHQLIEEWHDIYDEELVIIPQDFKIHYSNRYSFYIAMILVKMGYKITRQKWVKNEKTRKEITYIKMVNGMIQVSQDGEMRPYVIVDDDMEAEDYTIIV
ncbi:Thoeris anti-defense Tad2 family protein [Bacillus subtilis]|uniref:Uncharacterized protein n=1 Tax=Bacillus subtilis TaxID=1423 RepID=A0A8I1WGE8_BACIU|nr:hypothetical protein [Bacillus subtilis]KAF2421665.1 hypothetical protein B6K89_20955 [Bacillus subtilis]MBO3794242.1 hypothetical protein [Bacillus subtilis]